MSSATLGGTTRVREELMARVVPLSSAVICIESITSLCWGGSSRAAVPGVCLALVQGSCSCKYLRLGAWGLEGCCCILTSLPAQPVPLRGYCGRQRCMLSVCSGVLSSGRAFSSVVGRICYECSAAIVYH